MPRLEVLPVTMSIHVRLPLLSAAGGWHTHSCARRQPSAIARAQQRPLTAAAVSTATPAQP